MSLQFSHVTTTAWRNKQTCLLSQRHTHRHNPYMGVCPYVVTSQCINTAAVYSKSDIQTTVSYLYPCTDLQFSFVCSSPFLCTHRSLSFFLIPCTYGRIYTQLDGTWWADVHGYASNAVTLTFDPKNYQYVSRPWYTCDLIWVKLAPIVRKTLYSASFSGHCPLWLDVWFRNLSSTYADPNTVCPPIEAPSLY